MQNFLKRWWLVWGSVGCAGLLWGQRTNFLYALWDLDLEKAEQEALFEWNASYQAWDQHRIAFFRALFPLTAAEKKAFWDYTTHTERLFERQIAPTLPELTADVYLQRAVLRVLEREWVSAGLYAWKSWSYLRRSVAKDPLTMQLRGLWQVVFGSLPPFYERFLPQLPQARYEEARLLLREAAKPSSYTAYEAALLYFSVLKNFDTTAGLWLDTCKAVLFSQQPPPYLWQFAIALWALEAGRPQEAEDLLRTLGQRPQVRRFPYIYYWLGKLRFYHGDWEAAERYWQTFIALQIEPHGLAAQYGWRGYAAWVKGDTGTAHRLWQQALTYDVLWDEDRWVQALVRTWLAEPPSATEQTLWAARFLMEVAAYTRAKDTLEPLRENRLLLHSEEKLQLYYLYGRLYHKMGNIEAAKFAYYQATRQSATKNASQRAYAAYYLATLYEREADWHNARLYYTEAQSLAAQSGRSAVYQKARAGYWRTQHKRYPVPSASPPP
jgi:hypothetical protein